MVWATGEATGIIMISTNFGDRVLVLLDADIGLLQARRLKGGLANQQRVPKEQTRVFMLFWGEKSLFYTHFITYNIGYFSFSSSRD